MNILTPSGYKHISNINIGDEVIGKSGGVNKLLAKTKVRKKHFEGQYGFYLINGKYKFFRNQSIYVNDNVSHVYRIKKGDTIIDNSESPVVVKSIERVKTKDAWHRLDISGDHSYVSEDILLHNASRFLVAGGDGNWNNNNNWSATTGGGSGASFPVNGDAVTFDTNSGATNMTVNVSSACTSLVCTATYTGTLTFNNQLQVGGTVTFIAGMGIAGTGTLVITLSGSATITSGGKTMTCNVTIQGASTITLGDNWNVDGTLSVGNSTNTTTINANTISAGGNFVMNCTSGIVTGTTTIVMDGTGSTTFPNYTSAQLRNNFTINTAGTITISGVFSFNTGTFTYTTALSVVTSSSTFTNSSAGSLTIASNGIIWNAFIFGGAFTMTLSNNISCTSLTLHASAGTGTCTMNGNTINVNGSVSCRFSTGTNVGTTVINMTGTGNLSMPSVTTGNLQNSLTFNSSGTITMTTNIHYQAGIITYTAGTIDTATNASVLILRGNTTMATNGMTWDSIYVNQATLTATLSNNLQATLLQVGPTNTTLTLNGNTCSVTNFQGDNVTSNTLAGSSNFTLTGGFVVFANLIINKTNNITFAGTITWNATTFTYTSAGSVTTTGSTLTMSGSRTFAGGAVTWNNWTTSGTGTLTTNSLQTLAGTMTVGGGFTTTFAGSNGVLSCANLTLGASSTLVIPTNATVTSTTTINASGSVINGAFTLNTGGLTMNGNLTGTLSLINFNATGTWQGSGVVIHNTTVNTAGTLTISGTVHYKTGTFTYTAGTVIVTGSTLSIDGSSTFAGALTWNHWTVTVTSTITTNALQTLSGTFTVNNGITATYAGSNGVLSCANLTLGASSILVIPANATVTSTTTINASGSVINGAFTLNTGGLTMNGNLTGTLALINFNATGTWSGAGLVIHNTTVNTAGTLTISGAVHYQTGTFTYTAGTIVSTGSTLSIDGSATLAGAMTWNHWTVPNASTITINTLQTLAGTITLQSNIIFAGSAGWTANTLNTTVQGQTITFVSTVTYTVTNAFTGIGAPAFKILFKASTPASRAILTFTNPQNVYYVSATDIDSSLGSPVTTLGGVISNTLNWNVASLPTLAFAYIG